jgi:hypothetical protein
VAIENMLEDSVTGGRMKVVKWKNCLNKISTFSTDKN